MRFFTTAFAAAIVWVLMSVPAGAQPSYELLFKSAQVTLNENVIKINAWAGWANLSLAIVIMIGVMGIVIAGLQATSLKWKGVATAVVGGLVSGATAFNAATIPADYKTLNELVATGTGLIDATKDWLETGRQAATDPDRQFALDEIQKRLTVLAGLTLRGGTQEPRKASHFRLDGMMTVLHAAERAPQCACKRPVPQRMYGDVFGCGTASGPSLSAAHDRAVFEAAKDIATQLQNNLKGQRGKWTDQQLVDYIKQVATEFDSCPSATSKTSLTVLLRLPQTLGHADAITAFASRSSGPAKLTVSKIEVNQDGSAGDSGWAFDVLVDGKLVTRIPARDYSDRPATRNVAMSLQVPVDLPKGSYWLVEIKGQRTKSADTVVGAAAVVAGKPTQVAVANPVPEDGSFVFTVAFDKK